MAIDDAYRQQVALLLRLIPGIAEEDCFALKGGTAINLFVRDLPRLSVDIDLAYLPVADRETSLKEVEDALERIAKRTLRAVPGATIQRNGDGDDKTITRLTVRSGKTQVKVEVTPVLRGCVFAPRMLSVTDAVEAQFGYAQMPVVSFADLYAGKIVAALDRQHPRDLFDVRDLLAAEGITDELRLAFLVYVVSHGRPMSEVLAPPMKDRQQEFERGFRGMTTTNVTLEELYAAREALVADIVGRMPTAHRTFLIALKATGKADWKGLGMPDAEHLPAVQWKLRNLDKLVPERRAEMVSRLAAILGIGAANEGNAA